MALSKVRADAVDNTEETKDVDIIRRNGNTITSDVTIDSDQNAMSAGDITLNGTVTVNGNWSIV